MILFICYDLFCLFFPAWSIGKDAGKKPFQVLELYKYLNEVRPHILAGISEPKPFGRRPDKINMNRLQDQRPAFYQC